MHGFDYSIIYCRYHVPYNYIVISVIGENTVLTLIGKQNGLNFKHVNECTTYPHSSKWLSRHLDLVIIVHNYYIGTVGAAMG